jgi:cysteine desulfurase family protein
MTVKVNMNMNISGPMKEVSDRKNWPPWQTPPLGADSGPVYLDNAATSFPKPPSVIQAVEESMELYGGNPGRSSHTLALRAAEEVYACREAAAHLFGFSHPERVIFTLNTTHALNLVLKGLLRPGDRAVCSDMEHNAVFRPLYRLASDGGITLDIFNTFPAQRDRTEDLVLSSLDRHLQPGTRLVVCTHASNICPLTLPLARIGQLCHQRGILFVVDGAQSAGVLDIDMEAMHIDALCVPGHKGLMGPMGSGMLLLSPDILPNTLMEGGNGLDSLSGEMAFDLPERYEAGTLPLPAIAGLRAGIEYVQSVTPAAIREKEVRLYTLARDGLLATPGVHVFLPHLSGSTLLFTVDGYDSEEVAGFLDGTPSAPAVGGSHHMVIPRRGICVRPGFHCAALGHRTLGTPEGGAVRASFGWFNTREDAQALVQRIRALPGRY